MRTLRQKVDVQSLELLGTKCTCPPRAFLSNKHYSRCSISTRAWAAGWLGAWLAGWLAGWLVGSLENLDLLFILQDVRAHLSCALSSYQIEPTARDIPQNYIGIEALEPYQSILLFILRDV